jgi:hypothetical protein
METISRAPEALGESNLCKNPLFCCFGRTFTISHGSTSRCLHAEVDTNPSASLFVSKWNNLLRGSLPSSTADRNDAMLALDSHIEALRTVGLITSYLFSTAKTFCITNSTISISLASGCSTSSSFVEGHRFGNPEGKTAVSMVTFYDAFPSIFLDACNIFQRLLHFDKTI